MCFEFVACRYRNVLLKCWEDDPDARPSFGNLADLLSVEITPIELRVGDILTYSHTITWHNVAGFSLYLFLYFLQ